MYIDGCLLHQYFKFGEEVVDYHCVFVSVFTTAPCDNKILTQPVWPNLQAICKGVSPWSFLQHTCSNSEKW